MDAAFRYLKWNDDVVGLVAPDLSVRFAEPRFNTTVGLYTHGQTSWTPDQFLQFLSERIMSPARRDIERLLFRCGLSEYDVFKIADATRAINPRDELWLAPTPDASMAEAATEVFDAIFLQRTDAAGDSVDTPEGANVKRYGASQGVYGIVKQRISPLSTDVESEVAASLLAEMLGMPCCRAWRFGDDAVFSAFEYDFTCEYLVHMRRLFDGPRGENELENLLAVRPQYDDDLYRMIAFDFITRQDDRHPSDGGGGCQRWLFGERSVLHQRSYSRRQHLRNRRVRHHARPDIRRRGEDGDAARGRDMHGKVDARKGASRHPVPEVAYRPRAQ